LREQVAPPDLIDALRAIESQAARAGAIVHRLRSFLRKEPPTPVLVDINTAVIEAVSLFMPEARSHRTAVRTELEKALPPILGEAIQLEQVVINLLRNGVEAMDEVAAGPREMVVATAREGECIAVTVSDTGPGLSDEAQQRLFEPFFTTKARGMGLGLSTSRSIVEAHGGRLVIAKAPAGGTRATMILPTVAEVK
jgi:C4-dicarboxylate-specific signal transduction histidine kinase